MPAPPKDTPLSFAADIRPLFRAGDREAMRGAFDLFSHDEVLAQADAIAAHLRDGTMPCDAPWPSESVALFDRWVAQGGAA